MAAAVAGVKVVADATFSPHHPVRLYLRAKPRTMMVRTLKTMTPIGAELPFGPLPKCQDLVEETRGLEIDAKFDVFLKGVEREAMSLAAADAPSDKVASRTEGPKFVLKSAMREQIGARKTTAFSRAWRRTANWLSQLLNSTLEARSKLLRRKILWYNHPAPPPLRATEEQLKGFKAFGLWRSGVQERSLHYMSWVKAFREVALHTAESEERAAQRASLAKWRKWINEGPAGGLKRQHRFTRTAVGWMPTARSSGKVCQLDGEDEVDMIEGLSIEELDTLRMDQAHSSCPATAQQEVDDQAMGWHREWGAELDEVKAPSWPEDLGEQLPLIVLDEVSQAGDTFPRETGLGWDRLHPRAVGRISAQLVLLLVTIMLECEALGRWPRQVALVLIALLPKAEGGYRPIGLLPFLPRLWMRVRRRIAQAWEARHPRPYLYAGKGKGANIAAWMQGATAELAATVKKQVGYAQALLDMVKAFDRIPHWLLVREARSLGYPLRLLRLSLSTYLLKRVLRIGGVVSQCMVAFRGITAGSGFATTEMRVILIRIIDRALLVHPMVNPTLFVDDLAADMTAPHKHIVERLGGFIEMVADFIHDTGQELSKKKSVCTASTKELGDELCRRWQALGITFCAKVKALGTGLAAGIRRNSTVQWNRLVKYRARLPRFRSLRKVGIDTARLVRTGKSAMTYGPAISGVPPSLLDAQRRTAAAAAAPGAGTGGQNLDLALLIADGNGSGRADPAFDAHMIPIGEWAMAVWEEWLPTASLQRLVDDATLRLEHAKRPWASCYGPGASLVMTCKRLEWTVRDARHLVTHDGVELALHIDPPAVVLKHVAKAVERWRWKRIERALPRLADTGSGRGPLMEPIWAILNDKKAQPTLNAKQKRGPPLGDCWQAVHSGEGAPLRMVQA